MRENISVRQWQAMYRMGAFSGKDRSVQIEAGWYDWFCRDESLAGRLKQLAPVVLGITDPFILDNFYVWFKNNCPLNGPLYDDARFEPLSGERGGNYFLVIKDSPHEKAKWVLYTERYGFQEPEFQCGNVREMIRYVNGLGPQLGAPAKPSFGFVGEGGARKRTQFSPQAETKLSGLCDDAAQGAPDPHRHLPPRAKPPKRREAER